MKKVILLSMAFLVFVVAAYAQSSLAIPYQAVARDTTGTPIPNTHMNAQMSIYDSVATGTPVYVETDTFTTSNLGMFTINIGQGSASSGTFSAINWSKNPKFLQVGLDPTGGTSFINMGTAQLLNVPFALYAAQSSAPTGTGTQVPYFNRSGSFHSDALFTRNDSTYATQIFRAGSGSVNEGFSLGPALGGNIPDGAFLIRIDTVENHYDYIGEGNFSGTGAGFSNGIGITCQRTGNGPSAFVTIADSNPSNTNVMIASQNTGTTANEGVAYFDPYQVYIGIATGFNPISAIGFDSTHIAFFAGGNVFIWPESAGTAGQVLSTDGSGNLSWLSAGTPTGTATQVSYFNHSGVLHSDSLFTRNDSTYATQIFRKETGGINEGLSLGSAINGYIPDGVFLTRIDTPENHYDFIGEGNFNGAIQGAPNGIGLLCEHGLSGTGNQAFVIVVDSDPTNTVVDIYAANVGATPYYGYGSFSPVQVSLGINNSSNSSLNVINIDTTAIHFESHGTTWNWPTADGTNGQALTTNGSGGLIWGSNTNFANKTIFTPSSGNTITAVWGNNIINPSAGLSSLTITLPSSPVDNETVFFTFTNTITSLSFSGGTISGAGGLGSVSSVANGNVKYSLTYDNGSSAWY